MATDKINSDASDISQWLAAIGLERYSSAFIESDVDVDVLPDLTETDLESLGVSLGHRKRIMRAVHDGRAAAPADVTSGNSITETPTDTLNPGAERRHLTVMFVDLVGSTLLANRLDPEELRSLLRSYQQICSTVVKAYDGFVAQYLGDGTMAFFGYPRTHEDDALRAVRAGITIIEDIQASNRENPRNDGVILAVRVAIATGLVVTGDLIGEGGAKERAVTGQTPNLAARILSLANENSVVISDSTRQLIEGFYQCESIGEHVLKGFENPVPVYLVRDASGELSRFDVAVKRGLLPLIGRKEEVNVLISRWRRVLVNQGQVILLSGEAGIGKSRVVYGLQETLEGSLFEHVRLQCSPLHTNKTLQPIIEQLERTCGFTREDSPQSKLTKLRSEFCAPQTDDDVDLALIADLLSVPLRDFLSVPEMSPEIRRARTLEALIGHYLASCKHRPLLIHLEDAHWIDPTTLELFDLIVERLRSLPVMVLVTFRPPYTPPWVHFSHVTSLTLSRLTADDSRAVINGITKNKRLPDDITERIIAKTEGIPLFVEELTKAVLGADLLTDNEGRLRLPDAIPEFAIPDTIRDALLARMDQLSPARAIAQIGATIGREFSFQLIRQVCGTSERDLRIALRSLVRAELLFRKGNSSEEAYSFSHAMVQDVSYSTLLRSRRMEIHKHIAETLESHFPDVLAADPAMVAHHWAEGGQVNLALGYLQKAGKMAFEKSALAEAAAHLNRGLALLEQVSNPEERVKHELSLQTDLGWALIASKGYSAPETGAAFQRARTLCREVGESPQLIPVLYGQWVYSLLCADVNKAHQLAAELQALANKLGDEESQIVALRVFGTTSFWRGKFVKARDCLEEAVSRHSIVSANSSAAIDMFNTGILGLDFLSLTLLPMGYPNQAQEYSQRAQVRARNESQLVTRAIVLQHTCLFNQILGNQPVVRTLAQELLDLAHAQGYPFWTAHARFFLSWERAADATSNETVLEMRDALEMVRRTGAALFLPYYSALLAIAYQKLGQSGIAIDLIEIALTTIESSGERWFEAELYRVKGELAFTKSLPDFDQGEGCLVRAAEVARAQSASLWELRAARSLAHFFYQQGETERARQTLAPVLAGFSEGFSMPDLADSARLLDRISLESRT